MDTNLDKRIKNLDDLKVRVDLSRYTPQKKKGGVNGQIIEIRSLIVAMLNAPKKPVKGAKVYKPATMIMVSSLTRGWTAQELYTIYRASIEFSKNPQALFWMKYKEFIKQNGEKIKSRIQQRVLCKNGKESRKDKQGERQAVLF